MTLGTLKCTTIEDDASPANSITVADLTTLDTDKANLASPTFTGTVTMPATTALAGQASDVTIIDNNAAALEVKEGSTAYVTFDTTNSAEQIEVAKKVELAGDLEFTGSRDIKIPDNNANALDISEAGNNFITFDTTDSSEQIEVSKKVQLAEDLEFSNAKDILIPDNQAAGLEIKEGTNAYVTFDTTDSAEQIEVAKAVVASDNITLNAQNELRLADSDSSNFIAFASPATVTTNSTWTLPSDAPVANDVLTVTSVSSNNPTLAWSAPSGGLFESVAVVREQYNSGTNGGTFSSGDWRVRSINAEAFDPDSIVSVANNEITLVAGTYLAVWWAYGWHCNQHQTRLTLDSSTSSSFNALGSTSSSLVNGANMTESHGAHRFTLNQSEALTLQHRCASTQTSNGFGNNAGWGVEIYAQVVFYKES